MYLLDDLTFTVYPHILSGNDILIPRIKFHPKDRKLPVEMERVQFPIRLCFGITANKSQGQTYKRIGINLSNAEMFSHGQLYVALSRVGSAKSVSIFKPKGKLQSPFWKWKSLPEGRRYFLCWKIVQIHFYQTFGLHLVFWILQIRPTVSELQKLICLLEFYKILTRYR